MDAELRRVVGGERNDRSAGVDGKLQLTAIDAAVGAKASEVSRATTTEYPFDDDGPRVTGAAACAGSAAETVLFFMPSAKCGMITPATMAAAAKLTTRRMGLIRYRTSARICAAKVRRALNAARNRKL